MVVLKVSTSKTEFMLLVQNEVWVFNTICSYDPSLLISIVFLQQIQTFGTLVWLDQTYSLAA